MKMRPTASRPAGREGGEFDPLDDKDRDNDEDFDDQPALSDQEQSRAHCLKGPGQPARRRSGPQARQELSPPALRCLFRDHTHQKYGIQNGIP